MAKRRFTVIMPVAGQSKRFRDEGITLPKPLIDVGFGPLMYMALQNLPLDMVSKIVVVESKSNPILVPELAEAIVGSARYETKLALDRVITDESAKGSAGCALSAMFQNAVPMDQPVIVAGCDQVYMSHENQKYTPTSVLLGECDGLITCAYQTPTPGGTDRWPWPEVILAGGSALNVVSEVREQPLVPKSPWTGIGVWYFSKAEDLYAAITECIQRRDVDANGEYSISTVVNYLPKKDVRIEIVESFYAMRNPAEVDRFVSDHRYLGAWKDWRKVSEEASVGVRS